MYSQISYPAPQNTYPVQPGNPLVMTLIAKSPRSLLTYPSRPGNQYVTKHLVFPTCPSVTSGLPGCKKRAEKGKKGREERGREKGEKAERREKIPEARRIHKSAAHFLLTLPTKILIPCPSTFPPREGGAAGPLEPPRSSLTLARPPLR